VQQEITPEKSQIEDKTTVKSNELMDEQLVKAETTESQDVPINMSGKADAPSEMKATNGFLTPSKKHQVAVVALKETATEMEGAIVTNNPYLPLTSLEMTRSRGTSPKKSPASGSPLKKKPKVTPEFMQAMEAAFAKQQKALNSGLDQKLPGKVDVGVSLIG
jgi:hypothetical protein